MKIVGYLQTSLLEWPEEISAVVFIPGCNFLCPFCHNRNLVLKDEIRSLQEIDQEEILNDLARRLKWLDGVVVTGGEPTLQSGFKDFCSKIKSLGLKLMVETNGSNPKVISDLIDNRLVDLWAVDFKIDWQHYPEVTGFKDTKAIKKSIGLILSSKTGLFLRTTIVPTIHNFKVMQKMAKQIGEILKEERKKTNSFCWQWQNFRSENTLDKKFEKIIPFDEDEIKNWQNKLQKTLSFKIVF